MAQNGQYTFSRLLKSSYILEPVSSLRIYILQDFARVKTWGKGDLQAENTADDVIIY